MPTLTCVQTGCEPPRRRHKWLSKVAQLGSAAAALKKLMPVAAAAAAATETVDNCLALGYAVPRTWRTLSWAAKVGVAGWC